MDDQLARISELRETLDQILEKKDTLTPEMRILQQLWFDDMYVREDNIYDAEGNTFEWILDDVRSDEEEDQDEDTESNPGSLNIGEESYKIDGDRDADSTSDKGDASDNSSFSSSQTSWSLNTEEIDLRAHTQSNFQEWLRQANSVFHISGKAGSGKSTLVKLIVNDPRTYELLERWAGEKELVTAQFYFWRGGSDTQRSRQGLYRSLLFETLKQCPHLIQDVFPEAHRAFKKKSRENSIDRLFFRAEQIEAAFRKLVCLPASLGCRMCLFIDGLDEYGDDGVDSYEYEKLAKNLITWTKNDDIKILASSRPYREFLDAFSEDFRIHLHEVNAHDIQSFSRHMFEADDQFSLVKDHYRDLVQSIVCYSAGVFLWARIVTRSLIVSIHRGDPVECLERLLEVTPKDITKLYQFFFNSINKSDQERAFKMLLALARWKPRSHNRFNALFFSWLDQLQDPQFPMAYDMKPYTDQEILDRLIMVKRQIAGLTHGMLEITTASRFLFPESLFFGRCIQFFHRTARDFVLENPQLQKFHADHPDITDHDTYLRLDMAELWFSRPGTIHPDQSHGYRDYYNTYYRGRLRPGRLEALVKARMYHNPTSNTWTFRGQKFTFHSSYSGVVHQYLHQPESVLHYILTKFDASTYLENVAQQRIQLLPERDELSYLLSACILNYNSNIGIQNIRYFLSLGVSPMDRVLVHYAAKEDRGPREPAKTKSYAPVWSLIIARLLNLCRFDIGHKRGGSPEMATYKIWEWLELLLENGAPGNTFYLVCKQAMGFSIPTHAISLQELIQQVRPQNEEVLLRLINKEDTSTLRSGTKETFRNIRSGELENTLDPAQYKPFHINMWGPGDSSKSFSGYFLYSVWAGGRETMIDGLTVRIW